MSIVPNSLNITLNTSIPGNKVIAYKPSMTLSEVKENTVLFNPLIKLNAREMTQISREKLQLTFFNKTLFHSLNNLNSNTKVDSLEKATKDGYIDNNIQITLNALFPINSIITINKESYIIMDALWTKGDWKISAKSIPLPKLNDTNIYSPNVYNLLSEEMKEREEELHKIPDDLKYGINVTKVEPNPVIQQEKENREKKIEKKKEKVSFIDTVKKVESPEKNKQKMTNVTNTSLIVNKDTHSFSLPTTTTPLVNKETLTPSNIYKKRLEDDLYKKKNDNPKKDTIHINPFSDTDSNNINTKEKITNNPIGGNNVYNFNTFNFNGKKSPLSVNTKKEAANNTSYQISIDLQLYKGKTIPTKDIEKIKCMNKWNAVRKSFCNFTGQKYVIPPIYDTKGGSKRKSRKKSKKTRKIKT